MIDKELDLLDLGLFSKDILVEEYGQVYSSCIVVLKRNNYLNRLINEARANKCHTYCDGSIFRLVIGSRVNIEYWTNSNAIRVYGFKLYVWNNQKISNTVLIIIEGNGESYISGICDGKYIESYMGRGDVVLVMSKYNEKLSWECIS